MTNPLTELEVHVVHDADGRILALAPVQQTLNEDGSLTGLTPVPSPDQGALRLTLTAEHLGAGPLAVLAEYEVDLEAGALRRHSR